MKKDLVQTFLSLTLFTTLSFGIVFPLLRYYPEVMDTVAMFLGYFLMGAVTGAIASWICFKIFGK